jgi:hypothetical protein
MELKIIMLNEVSQTQKDKYHIFFSHMWNLDLSIYLLPTYLATYNMNGKEGLFGERNQQEGGE